MKSCIANIVPTHYLPLTTDNEFHMCLAHLALQDEAYANFYRNMSSQGKHVILDNGAYEDAELTDKELLKAIELINPTEVILPDELRNATATLRKSKRFWDNNQKVLKNKKVMVVPQGHDIFEWTACLDVLAREIQFDTIGIPKVLDERPLAVKLLNKYYTDKMVHLLGYNRDTHFKALHELNPNLRSMDTCEAFRRFNSGDCALYTTAQEAFNKEMMEAE